MDKAAARGAHERPTAEQVLQQVLWILSSPSSNPALSAFSGFYHTQYLISFHRHLASAFPSPLQIHCFLCPSSCCSAFFPLHAPPPSPCSPLVQCHILPTSGSRSLAHSVSILYTHIGLCLSFSVGNAKPQTHKTIK